MSVLLDQSCRVALAGLLHDLGKFAERAGLPEATEPGSHEGTSRLALLEPIYCPEMRGQYGHRHAAYTVIAWEALRPLVSSLLLAETAPFAPWHEPHANDTLITAAAKHHRPETFLQWVIATADRLASGFEQPAFARYNEESESPEGLKPPAMIRQWTLVEQLRLESARPQQLEWRYPLKPLSPRALFPVRAPSAEPATEELGQQEYRVLWQAFLDGLRRIPRAHCQQLSLWLDHFDTCWLTYTHAIPAFTSGLSPDVSLYDHSKTVAALAVALWRWYHDRGRAGIQAGDELRLMWDLAWQGTPEAEQVWRDPKFLLIQGNCWGIQDFIFATGGETQRYAAKLLRGRSFYISLLTECLALRVLEALALPSTSQVINAAGKFLIIAPNTPEVIERLQGVQRDLDQWCLTYTFGQLGLGLAWLPAAAADFRTGSQDSHPFRELIRRLFDQLERAKLQRFALCRRDAAPPVLTSFLDRFDREKGVCAIDGRSPATVSLSGEGPPWVCDLAWDHVRTGEALTRQDRLLITRKPLGQQTLRVPILGYAVTFTTDDEIAGRYRHEVEAGQVVRAWDFALPPIEDRALWNGYARRSLNTYVARVQAKDLEFHDRLAGLAEDDHEQLQVGDIKSLNYLALDDCRQEQDDQGRPHWVGVEALMTLKGDVDNLGRLFEMGLEQPSLAKMAALSRTIHAFFAIWLPWACQREEYRNTYTVFAGGDDCFIIGAWFTTMRLANHMRAAFAAYTATNPDLHFSAGLCLTKPSFPLRALARLAEQALDQAKQGRQAADGSRHPKNAVTCFGITVSWREFRTLLEDRVPALAGLAKEEGLSASYLYDCLRFTDMEAHVTEQPRNAIWHARFAARTGRLVEQLVRDGVDRAEVLRQRRARHEALAREIAGRGIMRHKGAYKIALLTYLYRERRLARR